MQAVTDEQLIDWVAKGDPTCLGTLFERYYRGVYGYCLQMTRHPAHAEDLVQDVFLKILKNAGSFRHDSSFKAWLFSIARNAVLDHLRLVRRHDGEIDVEQSAEPQLVDHRSAERSASARQDVGRLSQALGKLPIAAQEVIWLGRFEFDSYEELGRALGCKTVTARVRMHRAMRQLSAEFEGTKGEVVDA